MADQLSPQRRSRLMSKVRSKNTNPEIRVRKVMHSLGLRFRLHKTDLPGTPDIVLPKLRTVVFVHGCFWHRHKGCRRASIPSSNVAFWREKFDRNIARDKQNRALLRKLGWRSVVIWECQTSDQNRLSSKIKLLLSKIKLLLLSPRRLSLKLGKTHKRRA